MGRTSWGARTSAGRGANRGRLNGVIVGCAVLVAIAGCSAEAPQQEQLDLPQAAFAEAYADWAPRYVDCARSFGANAELLPDGAIQNPVAEGRDSDSGLDAQCLETVGPAPSAPPATEALLVGLYTLYVDQAECLREAGYVVSKPPSRREWVENYSGDSWNPLVDVVNMEGNVWAAMDECPQPDPVEAERIGIEQTEQG